MYGAELFYIVDLQHVGPRMGGKSDENNELVAWFHADDRLTWIEELRYIPFNASNTYIIELVLLEIKCIFGIRVPC